MIHLRVIAPHDQAQRARELLEHMPTACHVVHLQGASIEPPGDLLLADVPHEDASIIVGDLKELGIHESGSISLQPIDTQLSRLADEAEQRAPGAPADAVVWEDVEARTSEQSRLSASFLIFMVLAGLIAAVGILLDQPILIVGAMVVGPEFGPIAAFCVAVVEKRGRLAWQSFSALLIGFPLAITAVWLAMLVFDVIGAAPETFSDADHRLANSIANPDFFSFFVAFCAGMAGVLSLSTAKSGALIGVLISVTTIPAAANIGISIAYGDWPAFRGSLAQLALNVSAIHIAGTLTLLVQRTLYRRRRRKHLDEEARAGAGLPVGRSLRSRVSGSRAKPTPRASSAPVPPRRS